MRKRVGVIVAAGAILSVSLSLWAQSAPQTPETQAPAAEGAMGLAGDVQRGQYIVEHVAMCPECHSTRDRNGNILPETRFLGGPMPPAPAWVPDWAARAPRNAGLPGYSDEQAMRLLTEGAIGRIGEQLKAPMPRFRMNRQDAADVIAYMRTLPR
ncbi:MAG: cytochrome c [Vicinamibacterales bacterium]